MDLIPKLKYGIIKTFGTGRFMKLKNEMAKKQRSYYNLHKDQIDELTNFLIEPLEETEDNKEEVLAQKEQLKEYAIKMRDIQVDQLEFILIPSIVDELCILVEKIGNLCTVDEIIINDLTLDAIISLGYQIVKLDDPKNAEEVEEKKKITA